MTDQTMTAAEAAPAATQRKRRPGGMPDALAGWLFTGLKSLGLGLAAIAWVAVPIALAWAAVSVWLGRRQAALSRLGN